MTDLRQAWRNLRRTPWFSLLVIAVLTLGIGGSTAVFSVLNATLLRPLPYADSARLVRFWANEPARNIARGTVSHLRFEALRAQPGVFAGVAANIAAPCTLTGRGDPEQISGEQVSATFFTVLGQRLRHGRAFAAPEDAPGGPPVAILGHALWQRRFGGDPAVIGQPAILNGAAHTIVGILPSDFSFPYSAAEIWLPRPDTPPMYDAEQIARGAAYLNLTARLAPGATLAQARDAAAAADLAYRAAHPGNVDANIALEVIPFQEELVGAQRPAFWTLFAAATLVHLIACANIANLLLARFTARRREMAMRVALGAGRSRLLGLCALEALLLVLPACLLGAVLAAGLGAGLQEIVNRTLIHPVTVSLDPAALAFAVALSAGTALALGWLPAAQASRRDLLAALRESSQTATAAGATHWLRRALLVGEIALSFALLTVAALLGLSYLRLHGTDPGFDRRGVLLANIDLPRAGYPTSEKQGAFIAQLGERLAALPGVSAAAFTDSALLHGGTTYSPYAAADRPLPPPGERMMAIRRIVSPGFYRAVGLPLRRGRDFGSDDRPDTDAVAILSESAARLLFADGDPLGRKIVLGLTTRTATVIGIVGDLRGESLTTPPKPEVFFSLGQRPRPSLVITLRTADAPSILAPSLRAILRELDPELPLIRPRLLADDFAHSLADRRLPVQLLGVFGGLALLLAAFGIYSVTSYTVALRRPEIATRLVLGAAPGTVRNLILGQGLRLTSLGLAAGFALSAFAAGLLPRLLHGVAPGHPPAYLAVGAFVLAVSAAAFWLSALQAMSVDPVRLLREN